MNCFKKIIILLSCLLSINSCGKHDNKKIEITFNIGDETLANITHYNYNEKIGYIAPPTKSSNDIHIEYEFIGWMLDGKVIDISKFVCKEDTTFYASFREITYCFVTFDSNGGSNVEQIKVISGNKINKPNNPKKGSKTSLYEFVRWEDINNNEFDFNLSITKDINLFAVWKKTESYTENV